MDDRPVHDGARENPTTSTGPPADGEQVERGRIVVLHRAHHPTPVRPARSQRSTHLGVEVERGRIVILHRAHHPTPVRPARSRRSTHLGVQPTAFHHHRCQAPKASLCVWFTESYPTLHRSTTPCAPAHTTSLQDQNGARSS